MMVMLLLCDVDGCQRQGWYIDHTLSGICSSLTIIRSIIYDHDFSFLHDIMLPNVLLFSVWLSHTSPMNALTYNVLPLLSLSLAHTHARALSITCLRFTVHLLRRWRENRPCASEKELTWVFSH